MYSDWGAQARMQIAAVLSKLPADATLEDKRKALRAHSGTFSGGTRWGAVVWPRECRKALLAQGAPDERPALGYGQGKQHDHLQAGIAAGNITFPFRRDQRE